MLLSSSLTNSLTNSDQLLTGNGSFNLASTFGAIPKNAGVLVPPGDDRALTQALAKLMDDPDTRRRLASNALAARKLLPTWSQASRQFGAALEDLVSSES